MNAILRQFDLVIGDAMPYRTAVRWTSVLLLATLGGCNGLHRTDQSRRPEDSLRDSRGALRVALHQFENDFRKIAAATSKEVLREPMSEEHRQLVESWRSRITQECNTATRRDDPVRGLLDVWMISRRALNYFETGESTNVLGESQPIVLNAARRVHDRAEAIAAFYLKEKVFHKMRKKVAEGANANPIRSTFPDEPSFSDTEPGKKTLEVLLGLVEMPVRAVGELLQAPFSAVGLPQGLERASDVVEAFPKEAREQLQVLADDLGGKDTVRKAVDSFERFSKSFERLTQGLGEKPGTAEKSTEGVDRSQSEWGATVVKVRETAQSIERTVEGVPKAAEALQSLAAAIERAKKEIGTLWSTPDGRGESALPESREPFVFQQVTDSAEAWTQTVGELRRLIQEFRNLIESDSLAGETNAIGGGLDGMGRQMRGVVTHAGKWGVLLMALLFVLMLLYRAITNRFRTAHPAP